MFPGTLSDIAQNTLALLGKQDFLKSAYMAGGSSLALQFGHRYSIDFDFFTEFEFDSGQINKKLNEIGKYIQENQTPKTMVGELNGVKLSLFHYPYSLIAKTIPYSGVALASPEDIVAMKLVAITDRGTKKDFIDLYMLARKIFSIDVMLQFYDRKYHILESNLLTLIKSFSYFENAEDSDMPTMIEKISWEEVRKFFEKEAVRLANKYL